MELLCFLLSGFNVETVEYKNISFTVWDVGGQDKVCISFLSSLDEYCYLVKDVAVHYSILNSQCLCHGPIIFQYQMSTLLLSAIIEILRFLHIIHFMCSIFLQDCDELFVYLDKSDGN